MDEKEKLHGDNAEYARRYKGGTHAREWYKDTNDKKQAHHPKNWQDYSCTDHISYNATKQYHYARLYPVINEEREGRSTHRLSFIDYHLFL